MPSQADPSTCIAGVTFKNPILVSSSEFAGSPTLLGKLVKSSAGGVATKTFTSLPRNRIRVRPYQFPLGAFGRGYKESGCLYSLAAPHVEDMDHALDHVREMSNACHEASLRLIASFFEDPADMLSRLKGTGRIEGKSSGTTGGPRNPLGQAPMKRPARSSPALTFKAVADGSRPGIQAVRSLAKRRGRHDLRLRILHQDLSPGHPGGS